MSKAMSKPRKMVRSKKRVNRKSRRVVGGAASNAPAEVPAPVVQPAAEVPAPMASAAPAMNAPAMNAPVVMNGKQLPTNVQPAASTNAGSNAAAGMNARTNPGTGNGNP